MYILTRYSSSNELSSIKRCIFDRLCNGRIIVSSNISPSSLNDFREGYLVENLIMFSSICVFMDMLGNKVDAPC